MLGHAHHQAAVMTPVSGPPVLAVRHERGQVIFERRNVQFLDLFTVIKTCPHRVRLVVVLVQDVQIQRFGPPGHVGVARAGVATVHDRALPRRMG